MPGIAAQIRVALIVVIAGRLTILSGRSVGQTASKGLFFRLVRKALKFGSERDFRKWMVSSNPQIRALGLVCLSLRQPSDLENAIAPLLSDEAVVNVRPIGCASNRQTIAHLAKRLLADPTYFGHRSDLRR